MIAGEKTDVFLSEDIYATTSAETAFFKIYRDGAVVYEGRADVFPDGGKIKVYLNRTARGILDAGELPTTTGTTTVNTDGMAELECEFEDEEGSTIATSVPVRVWFGAGEFDQSGKVFTTCAINGHACPQMMLFLGWDARYSHSETI